MVVSHRSTNCVAIRTGCLAVRQRNFAKNPEIQVTSVISSYVNLTIVVVVRAIVQMTACQAVNCASVWLSSGPLCD